jgi:steroid delta-isomerase-like uncharacterized protein
MGLFGRKKKNKKQQAGVEAPTNNQARVHVPVPAAAAPKQVQVAKIVGDSKYVSTTFVDKHGRPVTQTQIVKLTPAELQQLGSGGISNAPPQQAVHHVQPNTSTRTSTSTIPPPVDAYQPPSSPLPPSQKRPPYQQQAKRASQNTDILSTPSTTKIDNDNDNNSSSVTNIPVGNESLATIGVTRELVKKFISDIWNRGEVELIPRVCHPSLRFNGHVGMDRVGHEGFARMVTTVREALTDYHCEIHSMVVETNKAFCRLRFTGKHTGNLLGYPPTGKTVAWMGASEFTCKNGKILKVWELGDVKSLEEQLRSPD